MCLFFAVDGGRYSKPAACVYLWAAKTGEEIIPKIMLGLVPTGLRFRASAPFFQAS